MSSLPNLPPEAIKHLLELVPGTLVHKSFVEPIGYLTIWFTQLELTIDIAIQRVLGVDDEQRKILSANLGQVGNKMKTLESLGQTDIPAKHKTRFDKIMSDCKTCCTERNKIVHTYWSASFVDGRAQKTKFIADGKLKTPQFSYTPESVMRAAELTSATSTALRDLINSAFPQSD